MSDWIPVAAAAEFPPGTHRVVDVDGAQIAVFNVDGQYYALRKFVPLRAIYARLRAAHSPAQIHRLMTPILVNEQFVADCIRACEATLAAPVNPPGA